MYIPKLRQAGNFPAAFVHKSDSTNLSNEKKEFDLGNFVQLIGQQREMWTVEQPGWTQMTDPSIDAPKIVTFAKEDM